MIDRNKSPYSWHLERTEQMFGCAHCGCKQTMANVDKDNKVLPGRICMKCAEPIMVQFYVDVEAPWKHSKGPWFAKETEGAIEIRSDTKLIATVNIESVKQAKFDSGLIATSPELLHWLNRLVDIVHSGVGKEELNDVIFRALEAIAKAEKWCA